MFTTQNLLLWFAFDDMDSSSAKTLFRKTITLLNMNYDDRTAGSR